MTRTKIEKRRYEKLKRDPVRYTKRLELMRKINRKQASGGAGAKYQRNRALRRFGLTQEWYEAQGGVCRICAGDNDGKTLHIDHDHATGTVRGLLCSRCNTGIGLFLDNPKRLLTAADYLYGSI